MASSSVTLQYSSLSQPPRWARWCMRPVGWPFYGMCGLVFAGYMWEMLRLQEIDAAVGLVLAFVVLVPLWAMRLIVALVLRRIYRQKMPRLWRVLVRFAWPLVLPAALLLAGKWVEDWAFLLARPAMNRMATDILAIEVARIPPSTMPVSHASRRVGQLQAVDVQYNPESKTIAFRVPGAGGLFDGAGFIYSVEAGKKPASTEDPFVDKQLDEHWWHASWD